MLAGVPAYAAPLTAEQLYEMCSSTDATLHKYCSIYVMGVVEGMVVANDPQLCLPGNVSYEQMTIIVREGLKATFHDQQGTHKALAAAAVAGLMSGMYPAVAAARLSRPSLSASGASGHAHHRQVDRAVDPGEIQIRSHVAQR
jgi:hypothetical protein